MIGQLARRCSKPNTVPFRFCGERNKNINENSVDETKKHIAGNFDHIYHNFNEMH